MIKRVLFVGLSACCLLVAKDFNFTAKPFGALGGLYNQGVGSSHSYGNFMAHAGVDFSLENGWSFGMGAIGGWNVFNKTKLGYGMSNYSGIGDRGDISDIYAHYKNSRLEFAVGRFNTDFVKFEYLAGNIQGGSAQIKVEDITYWGVFADSMLWTGVHKNTIPTLYGTNIISSYYPSSKNGIFGKWGEVFAIGIDYRMQQLKTSGFALINTQVPANIMPNRNGILFQLGGDVQYQADITSEWQSISVFRGIFQLGNTAMLDGRVLSAKDTVAGLLWFDQSFRFKIFEFGVGLLGVIGSKNNGGIYTFSDPSRFYGKVLNNPSPSLAMGVANFASPYFSSYNFTGYLFGSIDLSKNKNLPLKIDGLVALGTYTEYSIMLDYNVWKSNSMKFNAGIGYVYSKNSQLEGMGVSSATSSLVIFGKFFY